MRVPHPPGIAAREPVKYSDHYGTRETASSINIANIVSILSDEAPSIPHCIYIGTLNKFTRKWCTGIHKNINYHITSRL